MSDGLRLTSADERTEIRRIAEEHTDPLSDEDLEVLRYGEWITGLEAGLAAHHAGMVPPMKEAVEEAFAAGLVKMVCATETLSLGINMPARSVVIEKLSKFTGEQHEFLTPGEYTQLPDGRAARASTRWGMRSVRWSPFVPFDQVAPLASRRTYALRSSCRPTYNMAANLLQRYPADVAHHLLNLSFAQFQTDRDVVGLERQLERSRESLARHRDTARRGPGDIDDYRRLSAALDAERRGRRTSGRGAIAIERLKPGDVVVPTGRHGRVAVLGHERSRRGAPQVLGLSKWRARPAGRRRLRRAAEGCGTHRAPRAVCAAPERVPTNGCGTSPSRARTASRSGVRPAQGGSRVGPRRGARPASGRRRSGDRSAGTCSGVGRATRTTWRARAKCRRSEAWPASSTGSCASKRGGTSRDWSVTEWGGILAHLYTETDLVIAESLREGLLDGLGAAEIAGMVSCFTYERRGPDGAGPLPPDRWPARELARRWRAVERISQDLNHNEDDAGLMETRALDPGFVPYAHEWVAGEDLADLLADDADMTGGDFVRHVKQCIDLLRQVGDVAPKPDTAAVARAAADACFRGVIAASSAVGR